MKNNLIFLITISAALHVQAQESGSLLSQDASTESRTTSKKVEKIEVTGSHIKRIDVEGAAPVETITRADLDRSGYNSVSDVLRDTTVNSFGSTREASGSNAAGVAHVNLRGLGSSNTLVLLNGQRLPTDAVTGAVDLNLIPMAAVERIEVLKDGASAIYGSDALGGVVNIITRKDFSGNEVAISQVSPELEGGKKREISLVNGLNRGKLNMVNVVQYRDNDAIYSRDREWSNNGTSLIGSPGSYRSSGGSWIADQNCPAGQIDQQQSGDYCTFKHTDYSTSLPSLQQLSVLSESNIDVSSRVRMKVRAGATQRKAQWSYAPSPGIFVIKSDVADRLGPNGGPLPGATPGKDVQVRYRLTELGTRDTQVESKSYNLLLGTTVDIGDSWEFEASGSHNSVENKDKGVNGYALTSDITAAIASGQFNPFAPAGQKGSIEHTRYQPTEDTLSQISTLELKTTGEAAQLSSGPLGLAVGTTFTAQRYEDRFDEKSVNGEVFGNAGSSGGGQRDSQAVFTELSIPVLKTVELQIAGRYDHYSDFGSTANPKAAVLYHATPDLLVRTSVGTGFKAPLMQDLYAATSNGFPTFIDRSACNQEIAAGGDTSSCDPQQYNVTSSGNKNLREEKSLSYNAGIIYEPSKNFSIGTDWFLTKLNNVVGIDYNDAMEAEAAGINLAERGVIVNRDSSGYLESIEAPLQNLSAQEVQGLDISIAGRVLKRVTLSMEHSHLLYFKEEGFPGTGLKNKLGQNGRPPWRNTVGIGYQPAERHDITLNALTTAAHEKSVKEKGQLAAYTTYDMLYSYKSESIGTLALGVKNVLGTTPPLDDSNPSDQLDETLYDQIGRSLYTSYKVNF